MTKRMQSSVLIYPPVEGKLTEIWVYSSQWGESHADNYIDALVKAKEALAKKEFHQPFLKNKTANIVDEQLYFCLWKYKPHTPAHTVFYRILPENKIGVVEITGPGQQKIDHLRNALNIIIDDFKN